MENPRATKNHTNWTEEVNGIVTNRILQEVFRRKFESDKKASQSKAINDLTDVVVAGEERKWYHSYQVMYTKEKLSLHNFTFHLLTLLLTLTHLSNHMRKCLCICLYISDQIKVWMQYPNKALLCPQQLRSTINYL